MITPKDLARLLHEEFDRDGWGGIDPFLFQIVAKGWNPESHGQERDVNSLNKVLQRVCDRVNL